VVLGDPVDLGAYGLLQPSSRRFGLAAGGAFFCTIRFCVHSARSRRMMGARCLG
jgi:hypothetical protein